MDPDPTVDRKGIKYLQDSGVTVNMFDRDFQDAIRKENKAFIEQAISSARLVYEERGPKAVALSVLENEISSCGPEGLSEEALEEYRKTLGIADHIDSQNFIHRLDQLTILKPKNETSVPTGFGLLLFGKEPRLVLPQAGLLGTIHYPDGGEEAKDFDGPQVLVPTQVFKWLRDKLPNTMDRSNARRKQANEALYELVREGIVNALMHRDHTITNAKCHLLVTPDTIIIKSPGKPIEPITLEHLQSFDASTLSRNPLIHYVFSQMGMAEERGLGLRSLRRCAERAELPLPTYSWEDPYLVLTIYRTLEGASRTLDDLIRRQLSPEELDGWAFLSRRTTVMQSQYAEHLDVTARTAQRHLAHFIDLGMLKRSGKGPATMYEVARQ